MPKPFLILTLRRSGGTSFTQFLTTLSGNETLHEPLNPDRGWADVVRDFRAQWDRKALRAALEGKLGQRSSLKHCCELVPPAVTQELIAAAQAQGYAMIVLQRGRERDRLKSLYLAMATGAWGGEAAAAIYPAIRDGRHPVKTAEMEHLEARRKNDLAELGRAVTCLRAHGQPFEWVVFEEIHADRARGTAVLQAAAAAMGLTLSADDPRLTRFFGGGRQASQGIEAHLPQYGQIADWLARHFD